MSEQKSAKKEWIPDGGGTGPGRKGGRFNPIEFAYECWRTLCRHRLDNTGLTKSQVIFSNFFLHIQPVKVHRRTLALKTTGALGLISLYLFLILAVTGVLIMFHYVPSLTPGPDGLPD
ncbi:MAG: hypothetical protein GY851_30180, partial [bacterium]|nr:hypothetical protein [bacterium]